jgi:NCS1 family nucleobase:cation symporter-1
VNYFLGGLGAFLGPLFGIMAADYFLIRHGVVNINDLYRSDERGEYFYRNGLNTRALAVFVPTAAVTVVIALLPALSAIAAFAWPIGFVAGGMVYFLAMNGAARRAITDAESTAN